MLDPTTGATDLAVWVHLGTSWASAGFTRTTSACASLPAVSATEQSYEFHVRGFAERPRARVQAGACFVEGEFDLLNWFTDYYVEGASYPRFYVGSTAYSNHGYLNARMVNVEIDRVLSVVNGNACDGC